MLHLRGGQPRHSVVGGVGDADLVGIEHQHARHVERHISVADHNRARRRQVELVVGEVRVPVVPSHELGCRVRPGPVLAGDAQPVVGRGAHGVDDGVVALQKILPLHIGAQLDPAEEAEARLRGRLLVHARDRLDLRMVGRHARAHEAERRGKHVVEIDLEPLSEELISRVETRRPGADDCCPSSTHRAGGYSSVVGFPP